MKTTTQINTILLDLKKSKLESELKIKIIVKEVIVNILSKQEEITNQYNLNDKKAKAVLNKTFFEELLKNKINISSDFKRAFNISFTMIKRDFVKHIDINNVTVAQMENLCNHGIAADIKGKYSLMTESQTKIYLKSLKTREVTTKTFQKK